MLHDGYVNERYCGSHATLYVYLNHHIVQLYTILEKYLSQSSTAIQQVHISTKSHSTGNSTQYTIMNYIGN